MGLVLNGERIPPIYKARDTLLKAGRNLRCQYVGEKVKPGTEYVNHSGFLGNEADMQLHMKNLQDYLEKNPGDIETRISLANLEEIFGKN
jgi:hypothetical protein